MIIFEKIKFFIFPILVLGASFLIALLFILNPNEAKKSDITTDDRILVSVEKVKKNDNQIFIESNGVVVPAVDIDLKAQVAGEIIASSPKFIPGGIFKTGDKLFTIDKRDYELELRRMESLVRQAEADYELELGRSNVAQKELKLLSSITGNNLQNPNLALRKPQLAQAEAQLAKAKAELDLAQLNLSRTEISSPFNSLIIERFATKGDRISTQDLVAKLVNTDEYWVDVSVPLEELRWLNMPINKTDPYSFAQIISANNTSNRSGYIVKMTGSLDEDSRLANVIVGIIDPLSLESDNNELPLILGDYVKVIFEGLYLKNSFKIPLKWIHENNSIWTVENNVLKIKNLTPVFEDKNFAYFTEGIADDESIITSQLSFAVDGSKIRIQDELDKNVN